ncbi:MAG: hypothetical protein U0074_05565 [Kouleothrix sp.]
MGGVEAAIAARTHLLAADGHAVRIVAGTAATRGVTVLNSRPLLRSRGNVLSR